MEKVRDLKDIWAIHENDEMRRYVYRGEHAKYGVVACKVVGFSTDNSYGLIQREADIAAKLNHFGICPIYFKDLIHRRNLSYLRIFMPLVASDLSKQISIRREMAQRKYWSEESVWNIAKQVILALSYAQSKDICHRDIKPPNLLIDKTGRVMVADFGSGKELIHQMPISVTVTGTFSYFSPEMREAMHARLNDFDQQVSYNPHKSDVFSLGLTLVHMMNLEVPMTIQYSSEIPSKVEAMLDRLRKRYSMELLTIVGAMLEPNPEFRPDFHDLADMLTGLDGSWGQEMIPLPSNYLPDTTSPVYRKLTTPTVTRASPQPSPATESATCCNECRRTKVSLHALRCGHLFCSSCLAGWKKLNRLGRKMTCTLDDLELQSEDIKLVQTLGDQHR